MPALAGTCTSGHSREVQTMQQPSSEALVIVAPDDVDEVARRLGPGLTVRHTVSPRVFVVHGAPAALASLATIAGVQVISPGAAPDSPPQALTDAEMLFVSAWLQQGATTARPHDRLAWDAPGMTPPDPPEDPQ